MKTTDNKMARIVGGGFILIGSLIAIAGMVTMVRTASFVLRATKAPGVVIKMEPNRSSEEGPTYTPIFTFADGSGIVHTQRMSSGSSRSTFKSGDTVSVLYDSSTPERSKMDAFSEVWLGPLFLTGFGLLWGGLSCLWLFMASRGSRSAIIKSPASAPSITDPDFGSLQFVYDSDAPEKSFWKCEWPFPKAGTVICIRLNGGKAGPRPEARQFYLGLPGRFPQIMTAVRPQLEDYFKSQKRQKLPQDIFTVVKLVGFGLENPKSQPLLWEITFETMGETRSTITIPFVGDSPQEAEVWTDPDDDETPIVAAKDLRQKFRPIVDTYRRRRLICYPFAIIGMLTGIAAMASTMDIISWLGGVVVLCFLTLLMLLRPRLRCPACLGDTQGFPDPYCPECGSPLGQLSADDYEGRQCISCGRPLSRSAPRSYRIRYCTHCAAYLDERGI